MLNSTIKIKSAAPSPQSLIKSIINDVSNEFGVVKEFGFKKIMLDNG